MDSIQGIGNGSISYNYSKTSTGETQTVTYPNSMSMKKQVNSFGEWEETKHNGTIYDSQTFDGFGNVKELSREGKTYTYEYYKNDRIKQESSSLSDSKAYTYDARGNRDTLDSATPSFAKGGDFKYDALNRVTSFQTTSDQGSYTGSYTYFPGGLRASKEVNGETTRYIYLNGQIIEEIDENGNLQARNYWGNELLAVSVKYFTPTSPILSMR